MMFWLRFALRSCLRRRKETIVTLLGISFGVAALIVLGAIMVGVNDTMVENAVALWAGHVVLENGPMEMEAASANVNEWVKKASENPSIRTVLPRCRLSGVLTNEGKDAASLPTEVWLVSPQAARHVSPIPRSMVQGRYLNDEDDGILLGASAASELKVSAGDKAVLTTSGNNYTFEVVGVFDTGVEDLDRSISMMPLSMSSTFAKSRVDSDVSFMCEPGTDLHHAMQWIKERVTDPETKVMLWNDKLPEVAQLVDLNAFAMRIVIVLVIAILGFGVANVLLISVIDRYRYYAILKAIGARPGEVIATVLGEALFMCLAAGTLGTIIGSLLSLLWGHVGLDLGHYTSHNPHFSVGSVIHPRLTLSMSLGPQGLALVAAVLASLWPALVAARRTVSSGMRGL